MAEEHRCQAPRLCANNCGFFGSPATQDFCSKCYRDLQLKEQGKLALNQTLATSSSSSASSIPSPSSPSPAVEVVTSLATAASAAVEVVAPEEEKNKKKEAAAPAVAGKQANRCSQCRKRVGLTGFNCRCGMVFCGGHRYPEQHSCGFDFKTLGKEQIAKANPVVKGEKLHKI